LLNILVSGVYDSSLPQAPDSFGDIRSDAVRPSDHHTPAKPFFPAHRDGQQAAAKQRVFRCISDNRIAGRVLSALLQCVLIRVSVRRNRRIAADRPHGQVAVVCIDYRVGAVQRAIVRHQKQTAKEDISELPKEDDDQVRGEPGDSSQNTVCVRIAEAVADPGVSE